jgi:hypothetical protein
MKNLVLLALVIAPFVAGCDITTSGGESEEPSSMGGGGNPSSATSLGEPSASLATSQMSASMSAQSDGTTLKIYAALFDSETSEGITLDTGDFFTVSTGGSGDPLVLVNEPSNDPTVIHYSASLPAPTTAQDVVISFVRQNGGLGAPNTTIHVPAPFVVSTTAMTVSYGDDLKIQATPIPTDDIQVSATGSCLESEYNGDSQFSPNTFDDAVTFDQNGNGTFSTEGLVLVDPSSASDCNVALYLTAVHDGALDPAFGGGLSGSHDVEGTFTTLLDTTLTQSN